MWARVRMWRYRWSSLLTEFFLLLGIRFCVMIPPHTHTWKGEGYLHTRTLAHTRTPSHSQLRCTDAFTPHTSTHAHPNNFRLSSNLYQQCYLHIRTHTRTPSHSQPRCSNAFTHSHTPTHPHPHKFTLTSNLLRRIYS